MRLPRTPPPHQQRRCERFAAYFVAIIRNAQAPRTPTRSHTRASRPCLGPRPRLVRTHQVAETTSLTGFVVWRRWGGRRQWVRPGRVRLVCSFDVASLGGALGHICVGFTACTSSFARCGVCECWWWYGDGVVMAVLVLVCLRDGVLLCDGVEVFVWCAVCWRVLAFQRACLDELLVCQFELSVGVSQWRGGRTVCRGRRGGAEGARGEERVGACVAGVARGRAGPTRSRATLTRTTPMPRPTAALFAQTCTPAPTRIPTRAHSHPTGHAVEMPVR